MNGSVRLAGLAVFVGLSLLAGGCAGTGDRQSAGEWIDSASVTARVKAALLDDPVVKGTDVNVDVWRDVVQLNGFVETEEQKERAEQVAWGVPGVRGVENNLMVKSSIPADSPVALEGTADPADPVGLGEDRNALGALGRESEAPDVGAAAAVTAERGAGSGEPIPLSRIAQNPDRFVDAPVHISGVVRNVVGDSAFTIATVGGLREDTFLVVAQPDTVTGLRQGDTVAVRGTVRQFDRLNLDENMKMRLDDTGAAQWDNRVAIMAESVEPER